MTFDEWNIKLLPPSFSPWQPKKEQSRQIAVLMSGGVDSSTAAHLLKEEGWEVLGITMKIPTLSGGSRCCCGADAAFVCNEINIPHYYVDVSEAFEKLIIERFRELYAKGQTPNPCVECNAMLKFSLVWDFLEARFGISYLATGHYARVINTDGKVRLGRAKDKTKDQSYFLCGIAAKKLNRLVLPLGDFSKQEVRSIAAELNLSAANRDESMELCFAGEGDYRAALSGSEANKEGDMTDMHGNNIGRHKGISNYTLGQRRGVGFAGGKPLYVGKIDAETNTIALGTRDEVSCQVVRTNKINVLIPGEVAADKRLFGKIRSYGEPHCCKVAEVDETGITVEFDEPQFAPCPGQKLVLYDETDNIVAGGTIV